MTTNDDARPTVIQFTDPMCGWCWGSEPVLRTPTDDGALRRERRGNGYFRPAGGDA